MHGLHNAFSVSIERRTIPEQDTLRTQLQETVSGCRHYGRMRINSVFRVRPNEVGLQQNRFSADREIKFAQRLDHRCHQFGLVAPYAPNRHARNSSLVGRG
jgi:hypothetical protein